MKENYIATFILHALGDTIGFNNSDWEFNYSKESDLFTVIELICEFIDFGGVNGIDLFFRVVDHSNYSLSAWLNAITYFHEWLSLQNRTTSFQKMLGYLQCCEDSPENKDIDHRFMDLVEEMIKTHGYIG
jgi:hypothetical protein